MERHLSSGRSGFGVVVVVLLAGGCSEPSQPQRVPKALSPAAVVNAPPFYEIGYTVEDIEGAKAQFGTALGLTWREPNPVAVLDTQLENGQVVPLRYEVTNSLNGPPFIELLSVTGEGAHPFKANAHNSPSHLGFATRHLAADSDALVAAGFPRVATIVLPGVPVFLFAIHRGPGDILFELVDAFATPHGVCDVPSVFCPPP
ncbi:MAG TPA: VOC family protein [Polyangia bacterium]|nr:VOC family protein [Polyangia bacterium]